MMNDEPRVTNDGADDEGPGTRDKGQMTDYHARVAKTVKALVRKTGHREFDSHRVLFDAEVEQESGSAGS